MASIYPHAEKGNVTLLANIRYHRVQARYGKQFFDITGGTSGGTPDLHKRLTEGLETVEIVGLGSIEVSGSVGKGHLGTITQSGLKMRATEWSISRSWPLVDVTGDDESSGSGDDAKTWDWGIDTVSGRIGGVVRPGGPVVATGTQTLGLNMNLFGAITGTATVENLEVAKNKRRGGPMGCAFEFRYTGGHTYTGSNFSSTFDHDTHDPVETEITVETDSGETLENNALLRRIDVRNPYKDGGPLGIVTYWRFNG